jgi:DNA primase
MGKKVYWIYPLHMKNEFGEKIAMSSIINSKEVILVESIGDMLSLFENGIKNVLVTFGLDISSELLINLIGLNLKKITLSFNNDFNKQENRGRNACVKNYLKLLSHFNQESVSICLPTKNDFGEMTESEISDWQTKKENNYRNHEKLCQVVLKSAKDLYINKKLSKNIYKNVKKLPCYE